MRTELFASALRLISQRVDSSSIDWALTGSLSFNIRGLDIQVHDIDIQTDKHGALDIEDRLKEFVTEPVQLRSSPNIRSYFGKMNIKGVSVEMMGDIEKLSPSGEWLRTPVLCTIIEHVPYEDMMIPVLNLEYEYEAYKLLGRLDKANMIERLIQKGTKP